MSSPTLRDKILACLGEFPAKPAPDLTFDSAEHMDTYIRHSVSYSVEQGERVNAYLLVPDKVDKSRKNPAILAVHQHAGEWHLGKSEVVGLAGDPMYAYGLELCQRGYIVLCPDHLAFEERIPEHFRRRPSDLREYERFAFCKYIQEGKCLQTKYLHDLSVALDMLCSLDYVDTDKLGMIGHSLGGQETLWFTWYDSRIKASIASCGFGKINTIFRDWVNHNFALYVPGMAQFADIDEIVCDLAPRPFAASWGALDDIFPIDGVREIVAKAEAVYAETGKQGNFLPYIFEDEHCFNPDFKKRAYGWLDGILRG